VQLKDSAIKQLWITIRPHLQEDLEIELNTIAYKLEPFEKLEQIEFLIKFWQFKDKNLDFESLKAKAEKLIDKISNSIGSQKILKLIGIPLQCQVIGEVFEQDVKFDRINIYWLYEKFIMKKLKIIGTEKGEAVVDEKCRTDFEGINIMEIHKRLALKMICKSEIRSFERYAKVENCDSILDIKGVDKETIQRYGIVADVNDDSTIFVHRTFAEFLIAKLIIDDFIFNPNFQFNEIHNLIIKIVLLRGDSVIRQLLDAALQLKYTANPTFEDKVHDRFSNFVDGWKLSNAENLIFLTHFFLGIISRCNKHSTQKFITTNSALLKDICISKCRMNFLFLWPIIDKFGDENDHKAMIYYSFGQVFKYDEMYSSWTYAIETSRNMTELINFVEPADICETYAQGNLAEDMIDIAKKLFSNESSDFLCDSTTLPRSDFDMKFFEAKYLGIFEMQTKFVKELLPCNSESNIGKKLFAAFSIVAYVILAGTVSRMGPPGPFF